MMNIIEQKKQFIVTVCLEREYTVKLAADSAQMASTIAADYVQEHYEELVPDQDKPEVTSVTTIGENSNA